MFAMNLKTIFHNKKRINFNKPIGKHPTDMKKAEESVQVVILLK